MTSPWRKVVVSPTTVWDAPEHERFLPVVRRWNADLPPESKDRFLLAGSPVDWARVDSLSQSRPYFDHAP
jgi:hypothetical protein